MTLTPILSLLFALFLGFGLKESRRRSPCNETRDVFYRILRTVFGRTLILILAFNVLSAGLANPVWLSGVPWTWDILQQGLLPMIGLILLNLVLCLMIGPPVALIHGGLTAVVSFLFLAWREEAGYVVAVSFATLNVHAVLLIQQAGQLL